MDEIELEQVRIAMDKVKCPRKLDFSVFRKLTGRLPHEDLNYDDERLLIHFYYTFCNESIKLFGKTIRCRTNVLCQLLDKIGMEPNADLFQFMKGPGHQRTEEEIKFVFDHLGSDYSLIPPPVQLGVTFQGISIYDEFHEVNILLIILGNHLFVFPMENYSGNHPFVFPVEITHI